MGKGQPKRKPAPSRCTACGRQTSIPRWRYFKAGRPRCTACGGTLEYLGWPAAKKAPAKPRRYLVPAGTACQVRGLTLKGAWRRHTTRKDITCSGYLWRNEKAYGFAQGAYEVMVAVGSFQEI